MNGADPDLSRMEQALALAVLGEGSTSPNPLVGCVVVRSGRIVGSGYHRAAGEPHAEALALAEAGERARGATVYVNLEPCGHHGRTPPCTEAILRAGVARVVASITDPNPLVNGRGFRRLREGGVRVDTGLADIDARRVNRAFLHWHDTGRPRVTLKAAASLDGMISARAGRSRWITGAGARAFAHRLRLRHDAVLVGAGTVRRDDPRLTVRLPSTASSPRVVVLSAALDLDPGARLFEEKAGVHRPRIYASESVEPTRALPFDGRASLRRVPKGATGLDLGAVLEDLGREGVQSLLVEGGGRTWASFLASGLADEAAIFVAPKLLGGRGGTPLVDSDSAAGPGAGWRLDGVRRIALGPDWMVTGRVSSAGTGAESA